MPLGGSRNQHLPTVRHYCMFEAELLQAAKRVRSSGARARMWCRYRRFPGDHLHVHYCDKGTSSVSLGLFVFGRFWRRGPRFEVCASTFSKNVLRFSIDCFRRGKPLYLSKDRFQLLEQQWLAHRFDHTKKTWVQHRNAL